MLVAIDYDGTITSDIQVWVSVIDLLLSSGHQVVCATMRTPEECKAIDDRITSRVKIYATSRTAKLKALAMVGVTPDIWIDDQPHFLFMGG